MLKWIFGCDLNYKELAHTFKNSYLFKNDKQKNMSCTRTTISVYYNKVQKQLFKNSLVWFIFFLAKTCNPFKNESCWVIVSRLHPLEKLLDTPKQHSNNRKWITILFVEIQSMLKFKSLLSHVNVMQCN